MAFLGHISISMSVLQISQHVLCLAPPPDQGGCYYGILGWFLNLEYYDLSFVPNLQCKGLCHLALMIYQHLYINELSKL